ncbi:hypothetical protein [Mesorhizobium denitrificans]|uniref:Uncharacterized protein n=1 Tax=Mesorhizobium denitrificans TaxID=2294114 RepID=A0A371XFE4_9HYPH|nr:hypothetical protein [Mesorhizobium denitrificans]RFC67952.1 hypothetical protein DY251_10295 [Mesorhizobium denitrificans]
MGDQGLGAQHVDEEQGLSFKEVIRRLWAHRVVLALLPLFFLGLGIAATLAFKAHDRSIISYQVKLLGIRNGTYPNGTAFSPNDLKSGATLARLAEKFGLEAEELEAAIAINYDNPVSTGITSKYEQKLSVRNMQPAVIDSINTAYADELATSMRSGLRIDVNNAILGLTYNDAISLAFAIPPTWNETYLKNNRVLADTKLSEIAVTPIPQAISGSARLLVAGEQLYRIEDGLKIISEDNRLSGLTTSEGMNANDLKNMVTEFRTAYFNPLMAGGFSAQDPVAVTYREAMTRQIEILKNLISGLDGNLARLTGREISQSADFGFAQGPNLDQGALETVISLVKDSTYASYVEEQLDKRQSLIGEMSTVRSRLDTLIFQKDSENLAMPTLTLPVENRLAELGLKYRDLFAAAQSRLIQTSGRFYRVASTPAASSRSIIENIAVPGAAFIAGLIIALIYALLSHSVRSALREKRSVAPVPIRMIAKTERAQN